MILELSRKAPIETQPKSSDRTSHMASWNVRRRLREDPDDEKEGKADEMSGVTR
jgi:hypothetical protein